MFYYPTVLRHGSGCFSTIWLVATKGAKIPRRDFLKVNVIRTCDDVMSYVLAQVPPPQPGQPRPRFSLYLSSQLQYGIILVYHRQCAILLEELHQTVKQLLKQRTGQKIDLDDQTKQSLVLPDALSLMEATEQGLDPSFGVIGMDDALPSLDTLMRMGEEFMTSSSPGFSPELTSPAAAAAAAAAAAETGLTASQESITLREEEPVAVPTTEFEGAELPEQVSDILDLLLDQTDHFPEVQSEEMTAGDQPPEMERGQDVERERTPALTASAAELLPHTVSSVEALLLPQEEPPVSEETPGPPPAHLTPVSLPVLPSPPLPPRPPPPAEQQGRPSRELEEVPPTGRGRRRGRQLTFFDPETQIPAAELENQINQPMIETTPLPMIVSSAQPSAAELFNRTCTFLPEDVLYLWKRAATVKSLVSSDLPLVQSGPESTESEKEKEMEVLEETEQVEQRRQLSPREDSKDLTDSEMFSGLLLDGNDLKDISGEISPVVTSEKEGSVASRFVSALGDIPEVEGESLQIEKSLPPEAASAPVLFHSLLPPEAKRRTVSTIFQRLLEILSAREVCAEQNEPFGDITILPAP